MATISRSNVGVGSDTDEAQGEESDFKPLTAEEAQVWRQRHAPLPIWRVLAIQVVVGVLAVVVAALVTLGDWRLIKSVAYGVMAVLLPAAFVARALSRRLQKKQAHPAAALMALMVWEGIKIGLTIALLLAAPRLVVNLSWLALLAGFVVTIKASWVALWWVSRHQSKRTSATP